MANPEWKPKLNKQGKVGIEIDLKPDEYLYLTKIKGNRSWRKLLLESTGYYQNKRGEEQQMIS